MSRQGTRLGGFAEVQPRRMPKLPGHGTGGCDDWAWAGCGVGGVLEVWCLKWGKRALRMIDGAGALWKAVWCRKTGFHPLRDNR